MLHIFILSIAKLESIDWCFKFRIKTEVFWLLLATLHALKLNHVETESCTKPVCSHKHRSDTESSENSLQAFSQKGCGSECHLFCNFPKPICMCGCKNKQSSQVS